MEQNPIRSAPGAATDEPASPLNPAPDALDFDPVMVRYRTDGWTPAKQREYVEALADTGVAKWAAARVGMTEQSANRLRRRADARSFDLACAAAQRIGARRIVSLSFERAIEGTLKHYYYRGELVGEDRVYDNRLLVALLPRLLPLVEPTAEILAVEKNWQPFLDSIERGENPADTKPAAVEEEEQFLGTECSQDAEGIWWTDFPPPEGFDGIEERRWGQYRYRRTLTPEEEKVMREVEGDELAAARAERDRFFGFVPESEAVEFKSLAPPLLSATGYELYELSRPRSERGAARAARARRTQGPSPHRPPPGADRRRALPRPRRIP
jgi:hypothetical protein